MPLSGPYADQGKKLAELTKYGIEDYLNGYISINTYDVATEDYIRQAAEKMAQNKTQICGAALHCMEKVGSQKAYYLA